MAIVAGDILRTTIGFTLNDGTIAQNIFHHERTGIGVIVEGAHMNALQAWANDLYAEIAGIVRNDVTVNLAQVDKVHFIDGEWAIEENIGTFPMTWTPINSGEALPNMVSSFVTFKTARPRSVGRKFLIPFAEDQQAGSYMETATVTAVVAWADIAVNNIELGLLEDLVPGVPRTGVDSFLQFTLAVVTNVLGTQRRRRPGVGV